MGGGVGVLVGGIAGLWVGAAEVGPVGKTGAFVGERVGDSVGDPVTPNTVGFIVGLADVGAQILFF